MRSKLDLSIDLFTLIDRRLRHWAARAWTGFYSVLQLSHPYRSPSALHFAEENWHSWKLRNSDRTPSRFLLLIAYGIGICHLMEKLDRRLIGLNMPMMFCGSWYQLGMNCVGSWLSPLHRDPGIVYLDWFGLQERWYSLAYIVIFYSFCKASND